MWPPWPSALSRGPDNHIAVGKVRPPCKWLANHVITARSLRETHYHGRPTALTCVCHALHYGDPACGCDRIKLLPCRFIAVSFFLSALRTKVRKARYCNLAAGEHSLRHADVSTYCADMETRHRHMHFNIWPSCYLPTCWYSKLVEQPSLWKSHHATRWWTARITDSV